VKPSFFVIVLAAALPLTSLQIQAARTYPIVGTGQTKCYNLTGEIPPPQPGQHFYGQDAQHPGPAPTYKDNGDGTISDLVTGLGWVKARGEKMSWQDAKAGASACRVGGHRDWRMPSIKELYSLINFDGACGGTLANSKPYIDTRYFDFVYGDTSNGVRLIDCQDWSATPYVGKTMNGNDTIFGVNFADGRIKGYPKVFPGGREGAMYVRYVRGNTTYGRNDFHDNGDGTITDRATGLTWQKADSGKGLDWRQALAYAANSKVAGHSDWRLPNAKELQSIVDYSRAPATTQSAAISPLFEVTKIDDGDYPFFWTSTTHLDGPPDRRGGAAVYIAFGRATGWMPPGAGGPPQSARMGGPDFEPGQGPPPGFGGPPPGRSRNYQLLDVHGAGAQRSDPKAGDPRIFSRGRGPQGDVIRIYNYARLVRNGPD
jgi:hypothetical protein